MSSYLEQFLSWQKAEHSMNSNSLTLKKISNPSAIIEIFRKQKIWIRYKKLCWVLHIITTLKWSIFSISTCAQKLAHAIQRKNGGQHLAVSRLLELILSFSTSSSTKTFWIFMAERINRLHTWIISLLFSQKTTRHRIYHLVTVWLITNSSPSQTQNMPFTMFLISISFQTTLRSSRMHHKAKRGNFWTTKSWE